MRSPHIVVILGNGDHSGAWIARARAFALGVRTSIVVLRADLFATPNVMWRGRDAALLQEMRRA